MLVNWSSLIVYLGLCLIGIWVAYSFLNKNGLYLFSILAVIICGILYDASFFALPISAGTIIMPFVYLALITCHKKYGAEEAKNLFLITLFSLLASFVFIFFQAAYGDSAAGAQYFLSWEFLGSYVGAIIAFVVASIFTLFGTNKIKPKKLKSFWKLAFYIAMASVVDSFLFVFLVYTGILAFWKMLLVLLIKVVIVCLVSIGLGYFEKYLNREPKEEKHEDEKPDEQENLAGDIN